MKKLLLSISLLTIIISFQSCSQYPENEGGSIFSKQLRLVSTEWVSTEVIITDIENGLYEFDATDLESISYQFNRDNTCEWTQIIDLRPASDILEQYSGEERWMWRNNKSEIHFPDAGGTTWEILKLDAYDLWIIETNGRDDTEYTIKFRAANY